MPSSVFLVNVGHSHLIMLGPNTCEKRETFYGQVLDQK